MEENRCIICGLEKDGIEVKEDYIIDTIRWFKRNVTRNEKGYRLVVCKECYPKYKKARDSYTRREVAYLAIGVIFAALLIAFSGGHELSAVFYGVLIIIFMYLLAQLSYMPALKLPQVGKMQQAKTLRAPKTAKKKV
ncbi:MAG: hypothetical protein ACP5UH_00080 [Candidatus Micrarchaeia archaeon]